MARTVDVFGFDELEKAFKRCEKRYPNEADAFLMAEGQAVNKRTKALTPVRTRKLRNSWRLKKVKLYKGGKVRVVREQTTAPHGHLVELGHEVVRGGRSRERGRKLNRVQRSARGISSGGYVEGKHMLEKSLSEARSSFESGAKKLLDRLTDDLKA
ncbi:MAG: HK97 gp10 family phage protein [Clostridia bacterium]|nr:HK97 gp10 family phage protein [Clostridia bacterium]